ncbi:hypothetical protein M8J77_010880 [Diaphorina citri]|nr:hypothetical protein M8J77_010880 [Diaphorina citri]
MDSSVPMNRYVEQLEKRLLEQEKRLVAQEELISLLKEKMAAGDTVAVAGTSGAAHHRLSRRPDDRGVSFVGSRKSDNIQAVVPTKYTAYFVTRVHPDVSAEALAKDLLSNVEEMTSVKCSRMKTRYTSYSSFHVVVPAEQCQLVESDDAWPEGSLVKVFSGRLLPKFVLDTFDSNAPEKTRNTGPKKTKQTKQTTAKTSVRPSVASGSVNSPTNGRVQNETFLLGCTYIPPSSSLEFYLDHCAVVEQLCLSLPDARVYLAGDYNLPTSVWSYDDECGLSVDCPLSSPAVQVCESFNSCSLRQVNSWPNRHNVFLDLLFSSDVNVLTYEALDPLLPHHSNHNSFHFDLALRQHIEFLPLDSIVFDYKKCDIKALKKSLSNVNWNSLLGQHDLECVVQSFYNVLSAGIALCTPQKRIFSSSYPRWFSSELRKLTVEKKKAHAKFKRSNLQTDYIRFSVLREKCKYLSGKCHKDHLHKVSESIKSNPKYFWRFSEETRKVNGMPKQMTLDGVTCSAPEDIANLFSCSFSSAYQEPREQVPVYPVKDCIDFNTCQFSSAEVFRALSSLPLKFSSGPDNIPPFILRKCASVLANPLSVIFNRSLSSGIFPEAWKLSFIIPIFKSGDRCNVGNYRGVCIQSAIPKVLDKLVSISLSAACKHFISDEQHGFTAKRSTVTNLLCYQHDIIDAFQSSSCVHSIYTDVSKAFDRVDTRILIGKLKSYGIGDSFLSWLSSYFRGRTQSVLVGNSLSRPIPVLSGVGQGSHSGPLLFSLFFNDLPQVIRHSSVLMFADDVKLYKTIRTIGDCYLLQCDLDASHSWLLINDSSCLKNVTLVVKPPTVMEGQDTTLQCFYDLEGIPLYSVKWYRGRHEFYRFSPSEHPSSKIFPIPGIDVDVSERTAVRQAKFQFQ